MGLLGRGRSLTISSAVWIQYTNVTDGQTEGHRATAMTALTHSVARKKSVVFGFCTVVCLHKHGEVRDFDTLMFAIHYWLIWSKYYQNRLIFAKVIAKSLLARSLMDHSVDMVTQLRYLL